MFRPSSRLRWLRATAIAAILVGFAVSAPGVEVVILKDGMVLQGIPRKEMSTMTDPATGQAFRYAKDAGYEQIDEGPKLVMFSSQFRQPGQVSKETRIRPDYKSYQRTFYGRKGNEPLPAGAELRSSTDYDAKWYRKIRVAVPPNSFDVIEEQITYIDPYFTYMISPTHLWASAYRTTEFDPARIRKLLGTHPDFAWYKLTDQSFSAVKGSLVPIPVLAKLEALRNKAFTKAELTKEIAAVLSADEVKHYQNALLNAAVESPEPSGKPDAARRIAMARFMLDAGWLKIAKDDLEEIVRIFPDGVPKEAKEAYDKLQKDIDTATAALVIKELELALTAGRYNYAAELKAAFPEKLADAKQVDEATKLMAQLKAARERYDTGRRLLRTLLDEISGLDRARPAMAMAGGLLGSVLRNRNLEASSADLLAAGEKVYAELHPDTSLRIESFVNLAAQADREKLQGRDPTKKPIELLSIAVSGWALGKNGATPETAKSLKIWGAREAVLAFQRTEDLNTRNRLLRDYKKAERVTIDELAQIITLLPPADPENLQARNGIPVGSQDKMPPGVYKRTTTPTGDHPVGMPYFVKLPPEYHHGRAYPVLIVLSAPNFPIESLFASLSRDADRNGYILLAPDWTNQFAKGWEWKGDDHWQVTAVLREAVKNYCIDNDRVFLTGVADGGNMAMDIGISHPDLFAGVLPVCPIPKKNLFYEYWRNAQALPFYIVTGELAGASVTNLRDIFDRWMPRGFPSLLVAYKGRGVEWYSAEVPVMFDWMSRKRRVNITGVLKLDEKARQDWTTMRATDNRFYWLGVDKIANKHLIENAKGGLPAAIQGDISGNNVIRVRTQGITKFSVLLTSELIDWTRGVTVVVNGSPAPGYSRPKVLEPNLEQLLEDYRERGDRRVLLWGRLELSTVP